MVDVIVVTCSAKCQINNKLSVLSVTLHQHHLAGFSGRQCLFKVSNLYSVPYSPSSHFPTSFLWSGPLSLKVFPGMLDGHFCLKDCLPVFTLSGFLKPRGG